MAPISHVHFLMVTPKRCEETLACGHRCPSLCGERCPDQSFCKACGIEKHRAHVVDMINMTSYSDHDVDEDPVIFLPCGHFYATSTLDGHIEMHKAYEMDKSGVWNALKTLRSSDVNEKSKQCPDCRSVISSIRRYGRILKLIELRALERKHMAMTIHSLETIAGHLKEKADRCILSQLHKLEFSIRRSPMRAVFEACAGSKDIEDSPPPAAPLIRCLELRGDYFCQQVSQYGDEDFRAAATAYNSAIEIAVNSMSFRSGAGLRLSLAKVILKHCDDIDHVRDEVNVLLNWILHDSGLHPTTDIVCDAASVKEELRKRNSLDKIKEVMSAMRFEDGYDFGGSASDHWYECPNGHPYFIGNCGGAMQVSRCPECNEQVGGSSHQLISNNRIVGGIFRDALNRG